MTQVSVVDQSGKSVGKADLSDAVFGVTPNLAVMHQVVNAQLGARRAGTHNTKTRSEVAGGADKPWRQKGPGRARHGSIRTPQWRGGGVAHGPKPRSYAQRTPKKMKRLALVSALSDRAQSERVIVVDKWNFETPRTKEAQAALGAVGADGKVLIVLGTDDMNAMRSFANLPSVHCVSSGELNTYDVLNSDWVVFTQDTLTATSTPINNDDGSSDVNTDVDTISDASANDNDDNNDDGGDNA